MYDKKRRSIAKVIIVKDKSLSLNTQRQLEYLTVLLKYLAIISMREHGRKLNMEDILGGN